MANSCEDLLLPGTYSEVGPTESTEATVLGMVMVILCRKSLADKETRTKTGVVYGGNRKMSGYIRVWFIPGGAGEVRGQTTK